VRWRTEEFLPPLLDEARQRGLALVKVHSHLGGTAGFSEWDDRADRDLFRSVYGWVDSDEPHGSTVMLPGGRMFGRVVSPEGDLRPFTAIKVAGDDLHFWPAGTDRSEVPEFGLRIAQAFGEGTYRLLRRLRAAVVGCSGTGSLVVEQLARNSVGGLVLVDPDRAERKNLNRIPQETMEDALRKTFKVDVLERAVAAMGLGTAVDPIPRDLFHPEAVRAVAACDVVFGCMDSVDGRHLLNRLCAFYVLPYFDLGVKLVADGRGGIEQVCGTVHYVQPGGSSLLSRHLYTLEQVRAAGMRREDPAGYAEQRKAGYIEGVDEDRPAVISVNMLVAALAVNEFLARIHPFRLEPNGEFAIHRISLSHGIYEHEPDGEPCSLMARYVGWGDYDPPLGQPELSALESAA
jgi:hypothetical protein